MNIWVISDTHFNHENIKKYEGRPEEFNELIIANWLKVVRPEDIVIHLGDVIFGLNKEKELKSIMSILTGKKVLCRGNHDMKDWKFYMEAGFDMVTDSFVYDTIAFSHAPLTPLPSKGAKRWQEEVDLNIHGHFHRSLHRNNGVAYEDPYYNHKYYMENKNKYRLVQIEDELRPFSLEELLK